MTASRSVRGMPCLSCGSLTISVIAMPGSMKSAVTRNTDDHGRRSERISASDPGMRLDIRYALTYTALPRPSSASGRISRRNASSTMSWLAEKNATTAARYAIAQMSSFGCSSPKTGIAMSSSTCVASIQPRRRPNIGRPKRSMSGDHRNFHVYGSWISAKRPIAFKSTPSERSHAGSRLMSR